MLGRLPGIFYQNYPLAAIAAATATGLVGVIPNPFEGSAYLQSVEIFSPVAVTGDDTNTKNLNLQTAAGVEIAALDLVATPVTNLVAGVGKAMTFTGTAAQRTLAAGGSFLLEQEKVGTGQALAVGVTVRVGWKGIGL